MTEVITELKRLATEVEDRAAIAQENACVLFGELYERHKRYLIGVRDAKQNNARILRDRAFELRTRAQSPIKHGGQ